MPVRKANPFSGDPRSWYQIEKWRKRRRLQLRTEPLCAYCLKRGLVVPADIADHVEPHRGDPIKFYTGRLQSLCKPCHDGDKRYFEQRGYDRPTIGVDGWPIEREGSVPLCSDDDDEQ
jgi:5-methylcytosine-specific restriction endonuclease McrA